MKLLNRGAILAAYWRFLGCYLLLMVSALLAFFLFLTTMSQQLYQLRAHKVRYSDVLVRQHLLGQQVDSIYRHLRLLNTGLVRPDQVLEQRIVHENSDLNAQLVQGRFERGPHLAIYNISQSIDEILITKDSIRAAQARGQQLQQDLNECQLRTPHP